MKPTRVGSKGGGRRWARAARFGGLLSLVGGALPVGAAAQEAEPLAPALSAATGLALPLDAMGVQDATPIELQAPVVMWVASLKYVAAPLLLALEYGRWHVERTSSSRELAPRMAVEDWEHGELIRPVDQGPDSAVRRSFSEHVSSRSVTAVHSYWQQVIIAGRDVPPPELPGDRQVLDHVRRRSGAVGYVSADADTAGTKVLAVR